MSTPHTALACQGDERVTVKASCSGRGQLRQVREPHYQPVRASMVAVHPVKHR